MHQLMVIVLLILPLAGCIGNLGGNGNWDHGDSFELVAETVHPGMWLLRGPHEYGDVLVRDPLGDIQDDLARLNIINGDPAIPWSHSLWIELPENAPEGQYEAFAVRDSSGEIHPIAGNLSIHSSQDAWAKDIVGLSVKWSGITDSPYENYWRISVEFSFNQFDEANKARISEYELRHGRLNESMVFVPQTGGCTGASDGHRFIFAFESSNYQEVSGDGRYDSRDEDCELAGIQSSEEDPEEFYEILGDAWLVDAEGRVVR